jgi:hypothetical protein
MIMGVGGSAVGVWVGLGVAVGVTRVGVAVYVGASVTVGASTVDSSERVGASALTDLRPDVGARVAVGAAVQATSKVNNTTDQKMALWLDLARTFTLVLPRGQDRRRENRVRYSAAVSGSRRPEERRG